jgi:hypothetical protein
MGAQLVVWTCNGHLDQLWIKYPVTQGSIFFGYNLENRNSGQFIGVAGGSTDPNGAVVAVVARREQQPALEARVAGVEAARTSSGTGGRPGVAG